MNLTYVLPFRSYRLEKATDSDECHERRLKKPVGIQKDRDHFCSGTQEA